MTPACRLSPEWILSHWPENWLNLGVESWGWQILLSNFIFKFHTCKWVLCSTSRKSGTGPTAGDMALTLPSSASTVPSWPCVCLWRVFESFFSLPVFLPGSSREALTVQTRVRAPCWVLKSLMQHGSLGFGLSAGEHQCRPVQAYGSHQIAVFYFPKLFLLMAVSK